MDKQSDGDETISALELAEFVETNEGVATVRDEAVGKVRVGFRNTREGSRRIGLLSMIFRR